MSQTNNCVICGRIMSPKRPKLRCTDCTKSGALMPNKVKMVPNISSGTIGTSANDYQVMFDALKDIKETLNELEREKKETPVEKPELKLYEVRVWKKGAGMRPTSTTVVLDVDSKSATASVIEHRGYVNIDKSDARELTGPYHAGYIVAYRTLP